MTKYGKKYNKKNKRLKYLTHYEYKRLDEDIVSRFLSRLLFGLVGFLIVFRIFRGILPSSLVSFSFTFALMRQFYIKIIKPRIYSGRIKAYYRRSYNKFHINLAISYHFIAIGFMIIAIYCGMYIFLTGYGLSDFIPMELNYNNMVGHHGVLDMFLGAMDIRGVLLAAIISLMPLYILYYKDRYITISDYNKEMVYKMKSLNLSEKEAYKEFKAEQDKKHGIMDYNTMQFSDNKDTGRDLGEEAQKSNQRAGVIPGQEDGEGKKGGKENTERVIRRRARRKDK